MNESVQWYTSFVPLKRAWFWTPFKLSHFSTVFRVRKKLLIHLLASSVVRAASWRREWLLRTSSRPCRASWARRSRSSRHWPSSAPTSTGCPSRSLPREEPTTSCRPWSRRSSPEDGKPVNRDAKKYYKMSNSWALTLPKIHWQLVVESGKLLANQCC